MNIIGGAEILRSRIEARGAYRIPARCLQRGDRLSHGRIVSEVRPGPGRTVHIYLLGADEVGDGYLVSHMDEGVWVYGNVSRGHQP